MLWWELCQNKCLRSSTHWFIHLTVPEFVWNQTKTTSSAGSRYGCLVCTECDCCIHTCPKDPHQGGKRTWVRFNQTEQDRCEYTLSVQVVNFFFFKLVFPLTPIHCSFRLIRECAQTLVAFGPAKFWYVTLSFNSLTVFCYPVLAYFFPVLFQKNLSHRKNGLHFTLTLYVALIMCEQQIKCTGNTLQ